MIILHKEKGKIMSTTELKSTISTTTLPFWNGCDTELWDQERVRNYFLYSEFQRQRAFYALRHIRFSGNENLLDLGCRDGKVSALLARFVPEGSVVALDTPVWTELAKAFFPETNNLNLSFANGFEQERNFKKGKFDRVVSFFGFQWLKNPVEVLSKVASFSKQGSGLTLVMPFPGIPGTFADVKHQLASEEKWASYFGGKWPLGSLKKPQEYDRLLIEAGYSVKRMEIVEREESYFSKEHLINWCVGTLPNAGLLPTELRHPFFTEVVEKYLAENPNMVNTAGYVSFDQAHIEIEAERV
jgi:trans-aconitate 2-methyltransferase